MFRSLLRPGPGVGAFISISLIAGAALAALTYVAIQSESQRSLASVEQRAEAMALGAARSLGGSLATDSPEDVASKASDVARGLMQQHGAVYARIVDVEGRELAQVSDSGVNALRISRRASRRAVRPRSAAPRREATCTST